MCGLVGYINKTNSEESSETILSMLELQRHRGPDDSGIVGIDMESCQLEEVGINSPKSFDSSPNLVFGFNRLSILDVSPAGHQPMIDNASGVVMMMNGEVYNAFDYKQELENNGFSFKGHSDTEVVLKMYLAYGLEGMLDRLNGMFAIAIYDGRIRSLFLIRDRMGIKPLYVFQNDSYFTFSSEIKSFKALPNVSFRLDESRISEFLLFRNSINNTLFQDVINIKPGTYWKVDSKGHSEIHSYYNLSNEGNLTISDERKSTEEALKLAVKRQMISDVKLGCQLSGGVDSSMVTAYAANNLNKGDLETISIVFEDQRYSEKKYIDEVAETIDLKSHQITLNPHTYLDLLDEAVWHFEQPINHPNTLGIKLLSREAKKFVTVLLSGEGADESLAGYDRFSPHNRQFWNLKSFKKILKNRNQLLEYCRLLGLSDTRYLLGTAYGSLATSSDLYTDFSVEDAMASRRRIWDETVDSSSTLQRARKYELLSYLPDLLMRQDKMSMAHSIENRVPFLDNDFLSTVLSLSDEALMKKRKGKWEGKWILKELCAEIFGEAFSYRNKMGFGIPLKRFFASPEFQMRWADEILPGIKKRGVFKSENLDNWMANPENINSEQVDALWIMIGFEIWATQYLD